MLIPLTACFLSGLWLGSLLPYFPCSSLIVVIVIGGFFTYGERRGYLTSRSGGLLYASVLFGVLYWIGTLFLFTHPSDATTFPNQAVAIRGTVCEPVRHGPSRLVAIVCNDTAEHGYTRLRLTWREPDRSLYQGQTITAMLRLRPPSGMANPGGFDYGVYLQQQGIDAVGSVTGAGQVTVQGGANSLRWTVWRLIDQWRDHIRVAAINSLHGDSLGMYVGMIIGEPDYISSQTRDLFMATGTVHILSISGSHLGLIAVVSFFLIRRGSRLLPSIWLLHLSRYTTPTRMAALLTATPVVSYTLLAGTQVATVRSLVMILMFLSAVWLGRESRMVLTLALAAWLILLHDPHALFDISFQLSFVSVLAMAMSIERGDITSDEERGTRSISRVWTWLKSYGRITGAVTVATLPLVAYYFNQIPWAGFIGNLLVVPIAGFALVPVGLLTAIGCLLTDSATLPAVWINQTIGDALFRLVELLAAIPRAEWHVASPSPPSIVLFYLFMACALWADRFPQIRRLSIVLSILLVVWWGWSPRNWSDGHTVRVTFLDVGQGDASLIELPDHQTILIDGGATYDTLDMGRAVIAPYLWNRGISRLDHVIGTHPQLDHVGGLAWTFEKFSVGHFWSNGMERPEAFYQRLKNSLQVHGIPEQTAEEGQIIVDTDSCRLSVLNPSHEQVVRLTNGPGVKSGSLLNNRSIVTKLHCGLQSFLFTADIETEAIARLRSDPLFQARVVKVPHHGARSSLDPDWIIHTHPEIAVISVGRMNAYGHPTASVLSTYEGRGTRVLRTDRDGAVQITASVSSPTLTVHLTRADRETPVRLDSRMVDTELSNLAKLWYRWRSI